MLRPQASAGRFCSSEAVRGALGALAACVVVCAAGAAAAQTAAPPPAAAPGAPRPPVTSSPLVAPPPVVVPAPSAAPPPGLESGDTAPPGAARVETLDPTHAPPLTPPTAGVAGPLVAPPPAAPRAVPFYRRNWFWGTVGVVVITGIIVSVLVLATDPTSTPKTTLGDMHAF